ncbi:dipeptidase [Aspergillus melleus]|uniref:dipeptidase n=1 Tax=Aspergillus melleus TaxID=138277 RepID=UPI001E8CA4BC|nr:uncharacterized protein LDX57_008586 [Aspergillus melleus]KAH8430922.1 hypothetical protein LDX57_008586 [Aspergillus melleus]
MSTTSPHVGPATSSNTDNLRPLDENPNQVTLHANRRNGQSPTRRFWHWPSILATASIAVLVAPVYNLATGLFYAPDIPHPTDYLGRARRILKTTPLIDGHNDLPYLIQVELQNKIYSDFNLSNRLLGHTDLARMREGQMGGQFWSIYIDCEQISYEDDPTTSVRDSLEQIDVAKRLIQNYTSDLAYCEDSHCARQAFRSGKIASMLGLEGAHQVGNSIAAIRQFYDLGVRYITTTHNCDNAFSTSASTVAAGGEDGGLTPFGHEYVKEMNRLGMMIDLSHVSHQTMRDVLSITRAPVIFSHSGAYALQRHLRHVPDDVLRGVKRNGGIVMATFINRFLNMEDPDSASIRDVVDHIFHIAEVAGWEHVGVGGDYSGTPEVPIGLEDVSKYPDLVAALLERGATDEQARLFAGENILRVWGEIEQIGAWIRGEGTKESLPSEAIWEGRRWTKGHSWLPFMFSGTRSRLHGGKKGPKPGANDWSIRT